MIIYTDRLILRRWAESDAESLYEYAKDPAVGPAAGWPVHKSIEESRDIIKNVLNAPETYAVCLKEDNRAIGCIGLKKPACDESYINPSEMELGFWIGVPFWGNGYIPEAVRAVIHRAFTDLKLSALWCGYYDGNEKSKRVQEKCGFIYHHTEKDKPCSPMKDIRTEHYNYLTKKDWENNEIFKNRHP